MTFSSSRCLAGLCFGGSPLRSRPRLTFSSLFWGRFISVGDAWWAETSQRLQAPATARRTPQAAGNDNTIALLNCRGSCRGFSVGLFDLPAQSMGLRRGFQSSLLFKVAPGDLILRDHPTPHEAWSGERLLSCSVLCQAPKRILAAWSLLPQPLWSNEALKNALLRNRPQLRSTSLPRPRAFHSDTASSPKPGLEKTTKRFFQKNLPARSHLVRELLQSGRRRLGSHKRLHFASSRPSIRSRSCAWRRGVR